MPIAKFFQIGNRQLAIEIVSAAASGIRARASSSGMD
jgi:hypothetical protein